MRFACPAGRRRRVEAQLARSQAPVKREQAKTVARRRRGAQDRRGPSPPLPEKGGVTAPEGPDEGLREETEMAAGSPVCAVIGIGPGNGEAIARRFAADGYALALMARRT